MPLSRLLVRLALVCTLLPGAMLRPAHGEERWEAEVEAARRTQDREVREAQRRKSADYVVTRAKSRLSRQKTVLNLYLVGRALFHGAQIDRSNRQSERSKAKILESLRYMQQARAEMPHFWYAARSLAQLHMLTGDYRKSADAVRAVLQVKPNDLDTLKVAIGVSQALKQYPQLIAYAERALVLDPKTLGYRLVLVQAHLAMKQLDRALIELRILAKARPASLELQMELATLLYQRAHQGVPKGGKPDPVYMRQVASQLERVRRLQPSNYRVLSMLLEAYFHLGDKQRLERILTQMLPLAPDAATRKKLSDNLARLKRGTPAVRRPAGDQDPVIRLIQDAIDPEDVEKRRKALRTYLAFDVPFLPLVLYIRLDPSVEPDALCRVYLLRILGRLMVVPAVKHISRGMWDPDPRVRRVAYTELGRYQQAGILIYLQGAFLNIPVEPLPGNAADRKRLVATYNAARAALHAHTKFRDRSLMASGDIPAEGLAANRARWAAYFLSDRGIDAVWDALRVFEELEDPYPERYLLYLSTNPAESARVRLSAYGIMLRRRQAALSGDEEAWLKKRWRGFPVVDLKPGAEGEPERTVNAALRALKPDLLKWYQAIR